MMATVPDAMVASRGGSDVTNVLDGSPQLTDLTAAAAAAAMAFQQQHSLQQQPAYQQQLQHHHPHSQLAALRYPPAAVALPTLPLDMYAGQLSPCGSSDELDSELDDDSSSGGKRLKRGILPKQATGVMRAWLFQHLVVSISPMSISKFSTNFDLLLFLSFFSFRSRAACAELHHLLASLSY